MNSRRLLGAGLFGLVLAVLVGLLSGQSRRLSIDLWLMITTVWLGWLVVADVSRAAPVRPDRLRGVWRRRTKERPVDSRPRELANLEGLLINALHSDRATRTRLRPRLNMLSDHVLLTHHGIDRTAHPEQAAHLLGRVAWLVDPDADVERPPTQAELEQLLEVLSSPETTRQGTAVDEP